MRALARPAVALLFAVSAGAAGAAPGAVAPERVVTVGGAVTEIVYALGAGERVVGVDSTSTYPEAAARLPRVGYLRSLSAEGVLSLRPQAVLASADAGPPAALAQLRDTGVRVVTLRQAHTPEALRENVLAVAAALGLEPAGHALAQRLDQEWRAARAGVVAADRPRVLFLLAHAGNNALAAGADTAADAMIRLAGGVNALAEARGYKPLNAEVAVAAAPEVILITREGLAVVGGVDALIARPGLALTPAAQNRRVVALDALYLLGFGPRAPQAVRELAAALHGR